MSCKYFHLIVLVHSIVILKNRTLWCFDGLLLWEFLTLIFWRNHPPLSHFCYNHIALPIYLVSYDCSWNFVCSVICANCPFQAWMSTEQNMYPTNVIDHLNYLSSVSASSEVGKFICSSRNITFPSYISFIWYFICKSLLGKAGICNLRISEKIA